MYPSTVRMAWLIAGALDAARLGRPEECKARLYLALAAVDQQAVDRGSWIMAAEAALEPAPPFHSFSLHRAPEGAETPHSVLLDPRWCELFMARIKDISEYNDKKMKLSSAPAKTAEVVPEAKAQPKKPGKGGAKGKGEKTKDGDARPQPPEAAQS